MIPIIDKHCTGYLAVKMLTYIYKNMISEIAWFEDREDWDLNDYVTSDLFSFLDDHNKVENLAYTINKQHPFIFWMKKNKKFRVQYNPNEFLYFSKKRQQRNSRLKYISTIQFRYFRSLFTGVKNFARITENNNDFFSTYTGGRADLRPFRFFNAKRLYDEEEPVAQKMFDSSFHYQSLYAFDKKGNRIVKSIINPELWFQHYIIHYNIDKLLIRDLINECIETPKEQYFEEIYSDLELDKFYNKILNRDIKISEFDKFEASNTYNMFDFYTEFADSNIITLDNYFTGDDEEHLNPGAYVSAQDAFDFWYLWFYGSVYKNSYLDIIPWTFSGFWLTSFMMLIVSYTVKKRDIPRNYGLYKRRRYVKTFKQKKGLSPFEAYYYKIFKLNFNYFSIRPFKKFFLLSCLILYTFTLIMII
jgi:hypothetical protein